MRIAKLDKPGMKGDGGGLWLIVTARKDGGLSKRFAFRWAQV
jgi:hypothetical protein